MTAEITASHDAAVDAALGYLERHDAVSRRGHNGTEQVIADGFIAAAFRHRTSRAADPLFTPATRPSCTPPTTSIGSSATSPLAADVTSM